jgi:hypothetical protein
MRWLSLFVSLIYLNLLCAPQAFAVHDMRLASLADKQLQALTPSLQPHTVTVSQDSDDEPPTLLTAHRVSLCANVTSSCIAYALINIVGVSTRLPGARAPPAFLIAV